MSIKYKESEFRSVNDFKKIWVECDTCGDTIKLGSDVCEHCKKKVPHISMVIALKPIVLAIVFFMCFGIFIPAYIPAMEFPLFVIVIATISVMGLYGGTVSQSEIKRKFIKGLNDGTIVVVEDKRTNKN